jgi:hypothetical protein
MKQKSETRQHVKDFIQLIETQHNSKVKRVRTDNGIEFIMPQFYASKGIIHQTSCVESPEQNGRVERKHQHLLNVGISLLFQAKIPKMFWSYAIQHTTFFINKIPTPYLQHKSPYEMFLVHSHMPPHYKHIELNLNLEVELVFSLVTSKVMTRIYMVFSVFI